MSSQVSPTYPSQKSYSTYQSSPSVLGTQASPISAPIAQPISAPYYDKGCYKHTHHKPCKPYKTYYNELGTILVLFILLVIIGRAWRV